MEKPTEADTDTSKTARALLVLLPDIRRLSETTERIADQVAALAKRHGLEGR